MANEKEKLSKLRDQIDDIDNTIQDLLIQRTEVVEHVRMVKEDEGSKIKIRPSREAEILYRLIARHSGTFPKRELARIWRELIVATLSSEGPFSMAVYERETEPGYWDLARDQYGSFTPATRHTAARRVVEAVQTGEATIGIVPVPRHDDEENWWRHLLPSQKDTPRIIARLPFIGSGNARNTGLEALVICPIEQEETGRDRSYIAIELPDNIGFNVIEDALSQAGITTAFHQLWHDPERPPGWTYLIEIFGYAQPGGRQMTRLMDALGSRITRIVHLGGYAMPLSGTELAPAINKEMENPS
jgi:chorismate mutase / prephenate dehydratase